MKKLRLVTLAIASVALVGMVACNSTAKKETKEVVKEEVEQVEEKAPCSDSTAVADTVAVADSAVVEEAAVE